MQINNGETTHNIARNLNVSPATVSRIRNKHCPNVPKHQAGRKSKISQRRRNLIKRKMLVGEFRNATDVIKDLHNDGYNISYVTVIKTLKEMGFQAKQKKKKPFLSQKHKTARYKWAKAHEGWTIEDWKRVVFSDETKINLWQSDGIKFYWKRPEDPIQDFHLETTIKHSGGGMMLWGCMTHEGVGYACKIYDGTMTAQDYIHILDTTLYDSLEYYEYEYEDIIFQHDNDPKHTAQSVKDYLLGKEIEVLPWPAQSPDLNPIEHIWKYVKTKIGSRPERPTSLYRLWEMFEDEWNQIPLSFIENLYKSMPERVKAVLKAKGGYTRY